MYNNAVHPACTTTQHPHHSNEYLHQAPACDISSSISSSTSSRRPSLLCWASSSASPASSLRWSSSMSRSSLFRVRRRFSPPVSGAADAACFFFLIAELLVCNPPLSSEGCGRCITILCKRPTFCSCDFFISELCGRFIRRLSPFHELGPPIASLFHADASVRAPWPSS